MNNHDTNKRTPMGNARAEAFFLASRVPDTETNRKAIRQDAHYMMNMVPGTIYSHAVRCACDAFPRLASPLALAILAEDDAS